MNFAFSVQDNVTGIQRDCVAKPPDVEDGDCIDSDIEGATGKQCYCTLNNCNSGEAGPTTKSTTSTTTTISNFI